MSTAAIGRATKALREPWYALWTLLERRLYQGREYTLQMPYGHRVLTPWFDTKSGSELAGMPRAVRAQRPLVVSRDRYYMLYQGAATAWACSVMAIWSCRRRSLPR